MARPFDEDGRRGLRDRSHVPHHCPHRIMPDIADLVCTARRRPPEWGPGKLLDWLAPRHPEIAEAAWPAVSTAGDLLAREGLVKKRRRRRPHQHPGVVPPTTDAPNVKGQGARPVFERTFREFGRPRAMRTDNGVPFASCGIPGLSQLNVWWMRLGIQHQRIHPASPQENGAHERAPDLDSRGLSSAAGRSPRPATGLQSLPGAVQQRTAP